MDNVELVFTNFDAAEAGRSGLVAVIQCTPQSVKQILSWYDWLYDGDNYTVTKNGKPVALDLNGELE